jgi:predicted ester cyclase
MGLDRNYINHNIPVPGIPGTKDGFRELVKATRNAFPDLLVHVDNIVAEGDMVVFHDHVKATNLDQLGLLQQLGALAGDGSTGT